ncbi:hypothetical protein K8Q93_00730, partial [Candidatus Parcubacteria bacterium]|nr:hypothetical protein [Candidatus Parcubacteria bacterium]
TGWANLQANTVILGNGTGAVATTSAGTNGQVLTLVGGVPTWQSTTTLANISGTLGVTSGGTGLTSYTPGDITYASSPNTLSRIASSTNGFVLALSNGIPSWVASTTLATISGTLNVASQVAGILSTSNGGTGWGAFQANSILIGNGTGAIATTSAGTNGQVLALVGGIPTWQSTTTLANISGTLGVTSGGTGLTTVTTGDTFYGSGTNAISKLAASTNGFVLALSNGIPSWVASTTLSTISGVLNLASQVTGVLPVANGGTGWASLASGFIPFGNGSSAIATSSNLFWDAITGRLGIGSTTPGAKLAVHANNGETNTKLFEVASSTASATTSLFVINNVGNIGVGTSTPGALVDIYNGVLRVGDTTNTFTTSLTSGPRLLLGTPSAANSYLELGAYGSTNNIDTKTRNFRIFGTSDTNGLNYMAATGLFGVGTTTPWAKLAVNPVAGDTNQFVVGSSTATAFLIDSAGNVGIGTTSPPAKLAVQGSNTGSVLLGEWGGGTTYGAISLNGSLSSTQANFYSGPADGTLYINRPLNSQINFRIGGTDQMVLRASGSFGIGSTTPWAKLAVNPVAGDTNQFVVGSSTATSFLIDNAGKVGIGLTSLFGKFNINSSGIPAVSGSITSGLVISNGLTGTAANLGTYDSGSTATSYSYFKSTYVNSAGTALALVLQPTGGNVGVGSTTPLAKFGVHANNGDTNTLLFDVASSTASATTSLFNISNTGTATFAFPGNTSSLIIAGSNTNQVLISGPSHLRFSAPLVPNTTNGYDLGASGTAWGKLYLYAGASIGSIFSAVTPPTNGLIVQGNTGVGSSSPLAKLSVHGLNGDTNTLLFNVASSTAGATTSLFSISNTGVITSVASATSTFSAGIQTTALNVTGATSTFANGIQLAAGCFRGLDGSCIGGGSSLTGTTGQLAYFSGTNVAAGTSAIFLSGSLVGIGSTTPWAKLAVNPVAGDTNQFVVGSSTRTSFIIDNAGKVGIGTTSPSGILTVSASTSLATFFSSSTPIINSQGTTRSVMNYESYSLTDTTYLQAPKYIAVSNDFASTATPANAALLLDMFTPSTNTTAVGSLRGGMFQSIHNGTGALTAAIAITGTSLNRGNATATTLLGVFGSATNGVSGGLQSATTTTAEGVRAAIANLGVNDLITSAYGVRVNTLSNAGTITNTYGVHVGDITTGTQTNTPYSFYASDTGAYNFFATSTAIGSGLALGNGVPDALLHIYSGNTSGNTIRLGQTSGNEYSDIDYNRSGATTLNIRNAYAAVGSRFNLGIGSSPALVMYYAGISGVDVAHVGIGTTTPWAKLAVNPIAGDTNQFVVGSSTATSFIINPAGKVGLGLTAPATRLDVFEANAAPQLRLTKSASLYSELTVDSTGDLTMSAAGGDIYAVTENLWICDGGSCPALTATSTAGNIFVENAVTFGNGFSFRQISVNELGLYNASSSLLLIFDQGN